MRVIAGEYRSRRIEAPSGLECRPTPDRLREALFNILQTRLEGAVFVDVFAGSGSVGIEALSRGARRAIFVERQRAHADVLRANLKALGAEGRAAVFTGKALDVMRHQTGDIVFLDPPYDQVEEYTKLLDLLGQDPPPLVLAQHSKRLALPERAGGLERYRELRQGDNVISFYRPDSHDAA